MEGMHCRPWTRGSLKGQRPGGRCAALSQGRKCPRPPRRSAADARRPRAGRGGRRQGPRAVPE
eukprot:6573768-Lingulodinium_polyedra.AAC.1